MFSECSEERSLVLSKLLSGRGWQRVLIKWTRVTEGSDMDEETLTARQMQDMCDFEAPEV